MVLWMQAAKTFEIARDLDPHCHQAGLGLRNVHRLIETEKQVREGHPLEQSYGVPGRAEV
jgi:hypothetical protein